MEGDRLLKKSKRVSKAIQILFTGQALEQKIAKANYPKLVIDAVPFIETTCITAPEIIDELTNLASQEAFVVITSQVAVDWLSKNIHSIPNWVIACMQGQTQEALIKMGWGTLVKFTAADSHALAEKIISTIPTTTPVYFLAGNQRLTTIPQYLHQNGFKVKETIVYTTTAKKQQLNKQYAGIVFLSPSAVNSFFDQYRIQKDTVLFAIGATTAAAIQNRCENEIVLSKQVNQESLFTSINNYYQII